MHKLGKIILTRSNEDNQSLVTDIINKNSDLMPNISQIPSGLFLFCPVMDFVYEKPVLPPATQCAGVIVTSVHGVHADIDAQLRGSGFLDVPFYVVGRRTKDALKAMGFLNIQHCADDAGELLGYLKTLQPDGQPLLYLRGADISRDLLRGLPAGQVIEAITYRAVLSPAMPADVVAEIKAGRVGAVAFFSKRGAGHFMELVRLENLLDEFKHIDALCMSCSVLECVRPYIGGHLYAAARPNRDSMINLVQSFLKPV